ncbi:MAG: hypothetical protein QT11_C0001G0370 [archaeon GW2011_AR20]|nr:MAG: hypothetical protein QT11_C0001G0370 [archaeon GW2011_AR20]AQS28045.1 hypothetical protein [uncultured archaeon]AQS28537.1 hypothetical protein [uncultured archaeon]AQS28647.1 hypothetical protein [uncultured archaeon]
MAMMKRDMGGMCSCPHHSWFGWIVLVLGVLFLLQDLGLITWWGWLNWWTAAFVLFGVAGFCTCCGKGKCF